MNKNIKDFNNFNIEQLKSWVKEFHFFYKYDSSFYTKSNKQYSLGNKTQRLCRYCGRDKSQVTFKKNAHAIPKVIGNRFVKCFYECDSCNAIFGKYETDLSSFIGLRGYYETPDKYGKKRVRIYKSKSGEGSLYFSKRGMELNDPKEEIFEIFDNDKILKSKAYKNPYIPLNVYKALLKMSVSVFKDESMKDLINTIKFLITDEFDNNILIKKFAKLSCFFLTDFYIDNPIIFVFKKLSAIKEYEKKENILIPDKTIIIFFRDFSYQIFIPLDKSDDFISKETNNPVMLPLFPPMFANSKYTEYKLYPNYYHELKDLSSSEKIKDEKDEFIFISPIEPILLEYDNEEYEKIKLKYNLRDK